MLYTHDVQTIMICVTSLDIEKSIGDLANKARDGSITIEDMAGGTFTISNGGVYGSLMGTPILNLPQSAILGMHGTKMRAVVRDGKVGIYYIVETCWIYVFIFPNTCLYI
jgi:pyruvate/2-oxoglutarate dehydrogenase complex dihydrolipoamide acyltransferase (E2) component